MPVIEVARTKAWWRDRFRAYEVLVDGEVAGALKRGEKVAISVEPGWHEVLARIDWCGSPPVALDLAPGQTARLECAPNAHLLLLLLYLTIWRNRYVSLRRLDSADIANPS